MFLSFVDDSLFVSQEKSYEKSNANLFCSYNIISSLFNQLSLIIKYDKLEVFHFSRSIKNVNPFLLDLSPIEDTIFRSKDIWWYLRFFFDKKLYFQQHIHYYTHKALSTIKSMKVLGNLTRRLSPIHKHLLYRICVLSIVLYKFQLWYFKEVLLYQPLKVASLIPIYFHLNKISGNPYQLQFITIFSNLRKFFNRNNSNSISF